VAIFLTEKGYSASQSLIAHLETGRILNPDASLLRILAKVYDISYVQLIRSLVVDKYLGSTDQFENVIELSNNASSEPDLLDMHRLRSKRAFIQNADVLDVKAMAEWQRIIPNLKEYWVISPDFFDDDNIDIRDAVVENLSRGVNITYFIKNWEDKPGKKFPSFIRRLSTISKEMHLVHYVLIPEDYLIWMFASVVIANPDRDDASGYLIVSADGAPTVGIRMSKDRVKRTVDKIILCAGERAGVDKLTTPTPESHILLKETV